MFHEIKLQWKEIPVSLAQLESYFRVTYPLYLGNQAASDLTLYFLEQPSEEQEQAIRDHWDSLDGSDYKSQQQIEAEKAELAQAVASAKEALILKSWDEMSVVERKIAMNMEVTRADMGLE